MCRCGAPSRPLLLTHTHQTHSLIHTRACKHDCGCVADDSYELHRTVIGKRGIYEYWRSFQFVGGFGFS